MVSEKILKNHIMKEINIKKSYLSPSVREKALAWDHCFVLSVGESSGEDLEIDPEVHNVWG